MGALGISDTLALGLITEAIGKGLPMAALPFLNEAQSLRQGSAGRRAGQPREGGGVAVRVLSGGPAPGFGEPVEYRFTGISGCPHSFGGSPHVRRVVHPHLLGHRRVRGEALLGHAPGADTEHRDQLPVGLISGVQVAGLPVTLTVAGLDQAVAPRRRPGGQRRCGAPARGPASPRR